MYLSIMITGIGLLLLFRVLTLINRVMPIAKIVKTYISYLLPLVELLAWLGFLAWVLRSVYQANDTVGLIVLGVVMICLIAPVWFLLRDFLYGLVLKLQRTIDLGKIIEFDDKKGIVKHAGHFSFELENEHGGVDSIPYGKIRSKILSTLGGNKYFEKQLISLHFQSALPSNQLLTVLKQTIMHSPWMIVSQEPIVHHLSHENNQYEAEVFVYVLKKEHAEKIKEYFMTHFSDFAPLAAKTQM